MKVKSMKGFTLAELLIVMAIMVVLAAIAIPTFGKQLETARETGDEEVLRAALTDAFTQAYVDYGGSKRWANGATVASNKVTGADPEVAVADGQGAYAIRFSNLPAFQQSQVGFNYVTPSFRVGMSDAIPLTNADKILDTTAAYNAIVFVFAPNATAGKEAEITLVSATLTKITP